MPPSSRPPESSHRRLIVRVPADLSVVVAFTDGDKKPARVADVSLGGMNLTCERTPEYGEAIRLILQFEKGEDWHVLPAVVRWFSKGGFGVEFERLGENQADALARFIAA
jgi:c-di-GMP-binding flagellar brake protein YcgR